MANYHLSIYTWSVPEEVGIQQNPKTRVIDCCGKSIRKTSLNRLLDLNVLQNQQCEGKLVVGPATVTVSVDALHYRKEIYKPGWLRLRLQLTGSRTLSVANIRSLFTSCIVDLEETSGLVPFYVAKNWYIFGIKPEYRTVAGAMNTYVTLTAYSPDHFLTLDEYSRTYTCKRLFQDQLAETLTTYAQKNTFKHFLWLTDSAHNNLRHLVFPETTQEYILPYSVQYNESFHDFFVRIANRNGEFLYWENGVLQVGLPPAPADPVHIHTYESRSYDTDAFSTFDNTQPVHARITAHKLLKEDDPVDEMDQELKFESDAMLYNSEVSNESYWATLHKDNYDTQADLWGADFPMPFLLNTATEYLNETSLMDIALGLAEEMSTTAIENAIEAAEIKSDYKELFNEGTDEQYDQSKSFYAPFGSYVEDVKSVGKEFYHQIAQYEKLMDQSKMEIGCLGTFYPIHLGDRFYVDDPAESFITLSIEGRVEKKAEATYQDQLSFTAIPADETTCYPTTSAKGWIRTSGPQTAYVSDAGDPFKLGRIRIQYLWKSDEQDASPWIRVSMPKASSESGIFFLPEVGDEVLINYENGNVERPYMVGALHNARTAPNDGETNETITSVNGHQITFNGGSADDFLAGVLPAFGTLRQFIPRFKSATEFGSEGEARKLSGGITLSDAWGFYSISMSTDERAISIDCPLGEISLNAFTGITISAPNGNVEIEGKNVSITARNTLTLNSGTNIKDLAKSESFLSQLSGAALDKGKDMLKSYLCDLSLIRTILEVFLKPIEGTMRLSSKRYLCMEAGAGEAKILNEEYVKTVSAKQVRAMMKPGGLTNGSLLIRNIDGFICTLVATMTEKYNATLQTLEAYRQMQTTLTDANFPPDKWQADAKAILSAGKQQEGTLPELKLDYYQQPPQATQQVLVAEAELTKARQALLNAAQDAALETVVEALQEECVVDDKYYEQMKTCTAFQSCLESIDLLHLEPDVILTKESGMKVNRLALLKIRRETIDTVLPTILPEVKMKRELSIQGKNYQTDWEAMVDSIAYAEEGWDKPQGELSTGISLLAELTGFDGFADQYTWDQADRGEILFSNDDQTMHYNGRTIEPFAKERPMPLDEIKRTLKDITI